MTFVTRPNLEDRQFRQTSGSTLTLEGETIFLGTLISKEVEIDASTGGTSIGDVLTWNGTKLALAASSSINVYTGATPSNIEVGGVNVGTELTGRTFSSILEEILITTLSPVIVNPSHNLTENESPNTQEIGNAVTFDLTSTFSRGTITPQYDTNGDCIASSTPRSGLANTYCYTGPSGFSCSVASASGSNVVPSGSYDLTLGSNTWGSCVFYDVSTTTAYKSDGSVYAVALVAGNTSQDTVTLTGQYYRFYGASSPIPTGSTEVRGLPITEFQTANANTFELNTGGVETTFYVALPPGRTISTVFDLDALNANITSEYILTGTINVLDGGGTGTSRTYNLYEMVLGAPYSSNHRHEITTA